MSKKVVTDDTLSKILAKIKGVLLTKADASHVHDEYLTSDDLGDIDSGSKIITYTASFYYINADTNELVYVEGLLATDNFIASPIYTNDTTKNIAIQKAWNCIDRLYCDSDGMLNVYCFSKTPAIPDDGLHVKLTIFR